MSEEKRAAIARAADLHTTFLTMVKLRARWHEPDHDGALTALAWELAAAHREASVLDVKQVPVAARRTKPSYGCRPGCSSCRTSGSNSLGRNGLKK